MIVVVRLVPTTRRRCRPERRVNHVARRSNELDVEKVQPAAFTCGRKIGLPAGMAATMAPKSSHTALTGRESDPYSRCAIITLHTVLHARPLPLRNFEQAAGSLSERVERGPELIQPRVKVVQVSGARGRRYRENAGGGRGEQVSAPLSSHCTALR